MAPTMAASSWQSESKNFGACALDERATCRAIGFELTEGHCRYRETHARRASCPVAELNFHFPSADAL